MFLKKLKLEASAWTVVLLALLFGGIATAGTIKVWGTSDTLTAADLNGNFSHIHNLMVGGHGARLVDADVNASAAISSSKLAAYRYIPVAWGAAYTTAIGTVCSASPCASIGNGFTNVTRTSTGRYTINMTRNNNSFVVQVTITGVHAWVADCTVVSRSSSTANVECVNASSTYVDEAFEFSVYDDD